MVVEIYFIAVNKTEGFKRGSRREVAGVVFEAKAFIRLYGIYFGGSCEVRRVDECG